MVDLHTHVGLFGDHFIIPCYFERFSSRVLIRSITNDGNNISQLLWHNMENILTMHEISLRTFHDQNSFNCTGSYKLLHSSD